MSSGASGTRTAVAYRTPRRTRPPYLPLSHRRVQARPVVHNLPQQHRGQLKPEGLPRPRSASRRADRAPPAPPPRGHAARRGTTRARSIAGASRGDRPLDQPYRLPLRRVSPLQGRRGRARAGATNDVPQSAGIGPFQNPRRGRVARADQRVQGNASLGGACFV